MIPNQILAYQIDGMIPGPHGYMASGYYNNDVSQSDEDTLGMTITSGQVKIVKDKSNLIGISIGGGAPNCPCLYVIQIFDNSPAFKEGSLQPGDEITAVNGRSVKGSTRNDTAQAIQRSKGHVVINYNQLHVDTEKARSLDIVLKKLKHRITETIGSSTSDAFGLSRAILANDNLVKRLNELEKNELIYKEIKERAKKTFRSFAELNRVYKQFGIVFTEIGSREKQPQASEAYRIFGETHRAMEKHGNDLLKEARLFINDLNTFITKAIPDTKLTVKKYEDVKFEYLSYCLKVKEMDDEEQDYYSIQEPLYRVETGNYEYRLVLRSRQEARKRFNLLRDDVNAKIELLDQKHVQHLSSQLMRMMSAMSNYNKVCLDLLSECNFAFPLQLDLSQCFDFEYFDDQNLTEEATPSLDQTEPSIGISETPSQKLINDYSGGESVPSIPVQIGSPLDEIRQLPVLELDSSGSQTTTQLLNISDDSNNDSNNNNPITSNDANANTQKEEVDLVNFNVNSILDLDDLTIIDTKDDCSVKMSIETTRAITNDADDDIIKF